MASIPYSAVFSWGMGRLEPSLKYFAKNYIETSTHLRQHKIKNVMLTNVSINRSMTPNTPVDKPNSGFAKIRLKLLSGQLSPPDLNPIENLRGNLKRAIYYLLDLMPRCCDAVIKKLGNPTKY